MEMVKEMVKTGITNLALPLTFGAYHAYIIDLEHKNHREMIDLKNKLFLEDIRKTMEEERQKGKWIK